jgi:four helix bundle protein
VGFYRVDQFDAFRLAEEFKREVYRIVDASPTAAKDLRFKQQLFESASGVASCMAEGFKRKTPGQFAYFLRFSIASLEEAVGWLKDGVERRHFSGEDIRAALALGARCDAASEALYRSQVRRNRAEKTQPPKRRSTPRDPRSDTP